MRNKQHALSPFTEVNCLHWHWHWHWHDCRSMSLTVFCHITKGPCCAAFISFPLASDYWSGGSTHRATSGTHAEVCPRYCRDVCAQLLFSVLAIYSLVLGPPHLSSVLPMHLIYATTVSLFHVRNPSNLPGSLVACLFGATCRPGL